MPRLLTRFGALALSIAAFAALAATGARAEMAGGKPVDGIRCDPMESAKFHIHQHLTILDRGKAVKIPADVGRPVLGNCLYWLHTHTDDGLVHIESPEIRTFTLGNFFEIWGQPLDATHVGPMHFKRGALKTFVGGRPYAGDPRKIELTEHADIVLQIGPPYSMPRPFTKWPG